MITLRMRVSYQTSARDPSPSKDWGHGSRLGESRALLLGGNDMGGTEHNMDRGTNNMSNTSNGKVTKVTINTLKVDKTELSFEECMGGLKKEFKKKKIPGISPGEFGDIIEMHLGIPKEYAVSTSANMGPI